jgi:phosphoglycerate dehydrogenase-like enzyme
VTGRSASGADGGGRIVVVGPAIGGMRSVDGARRSRHGGERYRAIAESVLTPHGAVHHLEWSSGAAREDRFAELEPLLAEADALVSTPWLVLTGLDLPALDEEGFRAAPNLKVIAGTHDYRLGWIDLEAAGRRGVTVVDTSRAMTPTVAEFGVAITFALLRDIPGAVEIVRRGEWMSGMDETGFVFRDLADCRVGLAGYGSINRHYRDYVRPYGCRVKAFDPLVADDALAADSVSATGSLVELAADSDVFVVAIPPTPATLGVVDARVIDALARGSLFVLLSRMAVVDQEALWRRVRAGEIAAAVDVFDPEPPPPDAWFRSAPNVLPTPHIAGNVSFAHERCFREACRDAVRVLTGERPRFAVRDRDKRLYEGTLDGATETSG